MATSGSTGGNIPGMHVRKSLCRKAPSHGVSTINFDLMKTNPAEINGAARTPDGHPWIIPWTSQPFYEHHAKKTFLCWHRKSFTLSNNETGRTLT